MITEFPGTFVTGTLILITLLITATVAFIRNYKLIKEQNDGSPMTKNQRIALSIPVITVVVVTVTYVLIFL